MKKCTDCLEIKPRSEYYLRNKDKKLIQSRCKSCSIKKVNKWAKNNPDKKKRIQKKEYRKNEQKYREYNLIQTYGITLQEYNQMLIDQNNSCKICKTTKTSRRLCVDHCHKTGKIRGLLCGPCNRFLGYAKESIKALSNAIEYLKNNKVD